MADINLVFGVARGGMDGEDSEKIIRTSLQSIVNNINKTPYKIEFEADPESLKTIKAQLQEIRQLASKIPNNIGTMNVGGNISKTKSSIEAAANSANKLNSVLSDATGTGQSGITSLVQKFESLENVLLTISETIKEILAQAKGISTNTLGSNTNTNTLVQGLNEAKAAYKEINNLLNQIATKETTVQNIFSPGKASKGTGVKVLELYKNEVLELNNYVNALQNSIVDLSASPSKGAISSALRGAETIQALMSYKGGEDYNKQIMAAGGSLAKIKAITEELRSYQKVFEKVLTDANKVSPTKLPVPDDKQLKKAEKAVASYNKQAEKIEKAFANASTEVAKLTEQQAKQAQQQTKPVDTTEEHRSKITALTAEVTSMTAEIRKQLEECFNLSTIKLDTTKIKSAFNELITQAKQLSDSISNAFKGITANVIQNSSLGGKLPIVTDSASLSAYTAQVNQLINAVNKQAEAQNSATNSVQKTAKGYTQSAGVYRQITDIILKMVNTLHANEGAMNTPIYNQVVDNVTLLSTALNDCINNGTAVENAFKKLGTNSVLAMDNANLSVSRLKLSLEQTGTAGTTSLLDLTKTIKSVQDTLKSNSHIPFDKDFKSLSNQLKLFKSIKEASEATGVSVDTLFTRFGTTGVQAIRSAKEAMESLKISASQVEKPIEITKEALVKLRDSMYSLTAKNKNMISYGEFNDVSRNLDTVNNALRLVDESGMSVGRAFKKMRLDVTTVVADCNNSIRNFNRTMLDTGDSGKTSLLSVQKSIANIRKLIDNNTHISHTDVYTQLKKQLENLTVVENQAKAGILGVEEAFANMNTTGTKTLSSVNILMETFKATASSIAKPITVSNKELAAMSIQMNKLVLGNKNNTKVDGYNDVFVKASVLNDAMKLVHESGMTATEALRTVGADVSTVMNDCNMAVQKFNHSLSQTGKVSTVSMTQVYDALKKTEALLKNTRMQDKPVYTDLASQVKLLQDAINSGVTDTQALEKAFNAAGTTGNAVINSLKETISKFNLEAQRTAEATSKIVTPASIQKKDLMSLSTQMNKLIVGHIDRTDIEGYDELVRKASLLNNAIRLVNESGLSATRALKAVRVDTSTIMNDCTAVVQRFNHSLSQIGKTSTVSAMQVQELINKANNLLVENSHIQNTEAYTNLTNQLGVLGQALRSNITTTQGVEAAFRSMGTTGTSAINATNEAVAKLLSTTGATSVTTEQILKLRTALTDLTGKNKNALNLTEYQGLETLLKSINQAIDDTKNKGISMSEALSNQGYNINNIIKETELSIIRFKDALSQTGQSGTISFEQLAKIIKDANSLLRKGAYLDSNQSYKTISAELSNLKMVMDSVSNNGMTVEAAFQHLGINGKVAIQSIKDAMGLLNVEISNTEKLVPATMKQLFSMRSQMERLITKNSNMSADAEYGALKTKFDLVTAAIDRTQTSGYNLEKALKSVGFNIFTVMSECENAVQRFNMAIGRTGNTGSTSFLQLLELSTKIGKALNTAQPKLTPESTPQYDALKVQFDTLNNVITEVRKNGGDVTAAFQRFGLTATQACNGAVLAMAELNRATTLNAKVTAQAETEQERERREAEEAAKAQKLRNEELTKGNALLAQANKNLSSWTAAQKSGSTKEAYLNIRRYANELTILNGKFETTNMSQEAYARSLARIRSGIQANATIIRSAGKDTQSFGDQVTGLVTKFSSWFGVTRIIMSVYRHIRQLISASIELDNAMTQLRIVTNATTTEYEAYGNTIAKTAQRISSSMADLVDSTTTYARLGYNLKESSVLAEYTSMLKNVGDIEVSEAQDAITAITKAFTDVKAEEIEDVMNKLVTTGNGFPISVAQIAEGMNNASSALAAAGNTFEQSVALLTAANTTIQDASKSSTGLRTIAARIRKTKAELDDLGETMTEASYEELTKMLTDQKVALTDMNGEYRSTYDIMKDVAAQWENMTSMEQAALAEAMAGNRQQAVFFSMIEQFQEAEGSMIAMANSAGVLEEAYSEYLDSATAHLDRTKAAYENFGATLFQSSTIGTIADIGTGILNVATALAKVNMLLPAITAGLMAISKIRQTIALGKTTREIHGIIAATATAAKLDANHVTTMMAYNTAQQKVLITELERAVASGKLSASLKQQMVDHLGLTSAINSTTVAHKGFKATLSSIGAAIPIWGKALLAIQALLLIINKFSSHSKKASEEAERLATKLSEAKQEVENIASDFSSLRETTSDLIPEFVKLAEGVDKFGNNVNLTESDYSRFIELNNQLADLFPSINLGMSESGKAMLGLALDANTLNKELTTLVENERLLANQKMAEQMPTIWDGLASEAQKNEREFNILDNQLYSYKALIKEFSELYGDTPMIALTSSAMDLQSSLYHNLEMTSDEIESLIYDFTSDEGVVDWEGILNTQQVQNAVLSIEHRMNDLKSIMSGVWTDLAPSTTAWLQTEPLYYSLNDELKNIAQTIVNGLDPSQIDGVDTLEQYQDYIMSNIVKPLANTSPKIKAAFKDITDWKEELSEGEITVKEFSDNIKNAFNLLENELSNQDSEGFSFADRFINGFSQLGFEGENFEIIVDDIINDWARLNKFEGQQTGTLSGLEKTTSSLASAMETLEAAQGEMITGEGLSAAMIKKLADSSEDYINYLYEENGVIKLNVDAWREKLVAQAEADTAILRGQISTLEAERAQIELTIEAYERKKLLALSPNESPASIELNIQSQLKEVELLNNKIAETGKQIEGINNTHLGNNISSNDLHKQLQEQYDILWEERKRILENIEFYKSKLEYAKQDGETLDEINVKISEQRKELEETDESISGLTDRLNTYAGAYNSVIGNLDVYSSAKEGLAGVITEIDSVSSRLTTLADLQALVGEGFTTSVDKALEFAAVYPEILNGATVAANGQITLNEGVVNSFIAGKEFELKSNIDAEIAKLEADKATLVAKMEFFKAQLDMAKKVGEGEGKISKEVAEYRINAGNATAKAMIEAGMQEAEAYKLAAAAMSGNIIEFNKVALSVCKNSSGNFSMAAFAMAQALFVNMNSAKRDIASVATQARLTAQAIAGMAKGEEAGSDGVVGGSDGGSSYNNFSGSLTHGSFSGTDFKYTSQFSGLEDFISDLETDISEYENAIAQIDGQIAALQAIRNKDLSEFKTPDTDKSSGSGSGKSSGSEKEEEGESWFERQYKLHKHLIAMDTEEVGDFLDWLNWAYKQAYKEGIITLDDRYKYTEEVFEGLRDLFSDFIKDTEHEISMRENFDTETSEIVSLYEEMIVQIEKQLQAAREYGLDDNDDYVQELQSSWWQYTDAIKEIQEEVTDGAKDALEELLEIRQDMIKQDLENEKEALEEKLDYLKDFYDKQKDMLQDMYDEEKYLEEQSEKRKSVTDIEDKLSQLQYDDSAAAQKRKLELEQELVEAKKDIDDFEKEHALEATEKVLDNIYELQEIGINADIADIDAQLDNVKAIYDQALEDIKNGSVQLYEEMIAYNQKYGDGIDETIKTSWEEAYIALQKYKDLYNEDYKGVNLENITGYEQGSGWEQHKISGYAKDKAEEIVGEAVKEVIEETKQDIEDNINNSVTPDSQPQATPPPEIQELVVPKTQTSPQASQSQETIPPTTVEEGSTITVKPTATHFSSRSGGGKMASFVPGSSYIAYKVDGEEVLIGRDGAYTGWIKKSDIVGYATGTSYATAGWHSIDEKGKETIFESSDGTKYKMFTGGEKVLNAKASNFLYDFANKGSEILEKIIQGFTGKGGIGSIMQPSVSAEVTMGDIIIQGNADQRTVSEIRRAQRENVADILKTFNKLNR